MLKQNELLLNELATIHNHQLTFNDLADGTLKHLIDMGLVNINICIAGGNTSALLSIQMHNRDIPSAYMERGIFGLHNNFLKSNDETQAEVIGLLNQIPLLVFLMKASVCDHDYPGITDRIHPLNRFDTQKQGFDYLMRNI